MEFLMWFSDFLYEKVIMKGLELVLGGAFELAALLLPAQIKEHFFKAAMQDYCHSFS